MSPGADLRRLLAYQVASLTTGAVLVGLIWDRDHGWSFGAGGAVGLISVLSVAWVTWRTLNQKTVARTVVIIISKYALLLSATYYLTRAAWFEPVAAGLGLASFIFPALGTAVFKRESGTPRG